MPIVYHFDAAFHPVRVNEWIEEEEEEKGGKRMVLPSKMTGSFLWPKQQGTGEEGGWEKRMPSNS